MPGLVPGIHVFLYCNSRKQGVDGRDKPGHDGVNGFMAPTSRSKRRLPNIHPGEVLREEFLVPMKLSAYALAQACGVPRTRIERLAREETPVTADTALRLARYFGSTAEFWMGLQAQYDLERTQDATAAARTGGGVGAVTFSSRL